MLRSGLTKACATAGAAASVLALTAAATAATAAPVPGSTGGTIRPRYLLTDLTKLAPRGYNTPLPIALNRSGVVVGAIFSGGKPVATGSARLSGAPVALVRQLAAGTKVVAHVFVYRKGHISVVPTPPIVSQAYVTGLNDAGAFTVVTCHGGACDHYYVVTPARHDKGSFRWTALAGANLGAHGLGPIAANGDVAGITGNPVVPTAVVWRAGRHGRYSAPVALGEDSDPVFRHGYVPLAISSTTGRDIAGGAEISPNFFPDTSAALWGPKLAHDYGWIGSVTTALTGGRETTLATVGCTAPVPLCGPACPLNAIIDTVRVSNGLPKVTATLKLANPAKAGDCGVAPRGLTMDRHGHPVTVGLTAMAGLNQWLPEAVVWFGTKLETLTGLVHQAPAATDLQWALAINKAGQIIGTGTIGGVANAAYLLTPTRSW